MSLRQSRIAVQPLLSLLLLSCWLLAAAQRACGAGPSCSWPSAPDELVKTGSPAGSAWGTVGTNTFYQVRLQVPRTVQVTAIQLRMWSSAGQGRIIGRAGLYDSSSTLLQQSLAVNVSEAGLVWLDFPLQEALTLPAGDYSAAWWYDPDTSKPEDGWNKLSCASSSPSSYLMWQFARPNRMYRDVNGSMPELLAAEGFWLGGTSTIVPVLRLWGSQCANTVQAPPLDLQRITSNVLNAVLLKWNGTVAMGAAIVQAPEPASQHSALQQAEALCPHVLVSVAVAGVRRADSLYPEPVQVDDQWLHGSETETMTAVLIGLELEAGRLRLNTTLRDVFPYLPLTGQPPLAACGCQSVQGYFSRSPYACSSSIHPSWQNVTIAHLLTHSSGVQLIDDYLQSDPVMQAELRLEAAGQAENCSGYPLPSRRLHLQTMLQLGIPSPPASVNTAGPGWWADATDFVLLGAVLEELHSEPWESLAQRLLFRPLGMSTAGFGVPAAQVPLGRRAVQPYGHPESADGVRRSSDADRPHAWAPANGVHASMADWARWTACQLLSTSNQSTVLSASAASDSPGLLSAPWWRLLHRPYPFPSSPGTVIPYTPSAFEQLASNADGSYLNRVGANGRSNSGWRSNLQMAPEAARPMAIILMSNVDLESGIEEANRALHIAYRAWMGQHGSEQPVAWSSSTASQQLPEDAEDDSTMLVLSTLTAALILAAIAVIVCLYRQRSQPQSDHNASIASSRSSSLERSEELLDRATDPAEAPL